MKNIINFSLVSALFLSHACGYGMLMTIAKQCHTKIPQKTMSAHTFQVSKSCIQQLAEVDSYMQQFKHHYLQFVHNKKQHGTIQQPSTLLKQLINPQLPTDNFLSTAQWHCRSEFFEYYLPNVYASIDSAFETAYEAIKQNIIIAQNKNLSPTEHVTLALNSPLFKLTVDQALSDIAEQFKHELIKEDKLNIPTNTIHCFPFQTYDAETKEQFSNE